MARGQTSNYFACVDIFPSEVYEAVNAYLGRSQKVTFGKPGRPFTRSEELLPEQLVDRCRDILDNLDVPTRTVHFAPYKARDVPRHVAYGIAKWAVTQYGCTLPAVANALNYHTNTFVLWNIRRGSQHAMTPPSPENWQKYLEAGKEHCAKIGARERAPTSVHYVWVGWLRSLVPAAIKTMHDNIKALALAGGPMRAAEVVYGIVSADLAKLAKWLPYGAVKLPHGDATAHTAKGRWFAETYAVPIVTRVVPWVGWFLDYTKIDLAPPIKSED